MSSFYEYFISFTKKEENQYYAVCPFHNDKNESFTVNEEKDAWFCHGCGEGGHYIEFVEKWYDIPKDQAKYVVEKLVNFFKNPMPSEDYVEKCQSRMTDFDYNLFESWGITRNILKKYQIGKDDLRYTIPIRSRTGRIINVRKYLPPNKRQVEGESKVVGLAKCNKARWYPYESLMNGQEKVFIVEGEKDCLNALSHGFNAVTSTGGSNFPDNEWEMFRNKIVYIVGDNDDPGQKLVNNYLKNLRGVAKELFVIDIPQPYKDFTEYYMGDISANILEHVRQRLVIPGPSKPVQPVEKPVLQAFDGEKEEEKLPSMTLAKSEHVQNINEHLILENMSVIGTDPIIYTVPIKIKMNCTSSSCTKSCPIGASRNGIDIEVEPRQILQFIDSNDLAQENYLKSIANCKHVSAQPMTFTNVQRVIFQETASFVTGLEESSFEPRFGIYLYDEDRLMPSVKYDFHTIRVTNPRNQQNYYVITEAKTVQASNVKFAPGCLEYFQGVAKQATRLDQIIKFHYNKWISKLGIEQREDLFAAMLLTFLSVTEIRWNNGIIKGWLDTMIIGDTRTGKSQMAQRLVQALKVGSYINGENSRRTGVIGGVQKLGESWVITWGAIPMNDKGLLVIDEASGLEVEDIKELSASRSSGAVTINKIAKGEARARTRLIWLSNPRSGRNIEDFYWRGFGAFQEFIPVAEDQARYDLVLSAAREDVRSVEGGYSEEILPEKVVDLYRQLIDFAWNVSKENVFIRNPSTIGKIVHELSEEFEGGPLFVGVAGHEKVLRLSCAIAVLCGSIVGTRLYVEDIHIEWAKEFFQTMFTKKTLDYAGFIEENKKAQRAAQENVAFVRCLLQQYKAMKVLLTSSRFRGTQIGEVLGVDRNEASRILSELLQRGLMKISYNGTYQPDKLLVDIARQI